MSVAATPSRRSSCRSPSSTVMASIFASSAPGPALLVPPSPRARRLYYPVLPGLLNMPLYAAEISSTSISSRTVSFSDVDGVGHSRSLGSLSLPGADTYLPLRTGSAPARSGLCLRYNGMERREPGFFKHGPSVLFLSIALWALLRGGSTVPWAGLALGLAVINRPTNIAIALPLAIYVLRYERRHSLWIRRACDSTGVFSYVVRKRTRGSPFSPAQPVSPADFTGHFWSGTGGSPPQPLARALRVLPDLSLCDSGRSKQLSIRPARKATLAALSRRRIVLTYRSTPAG